MLQLVTLELPAALERKELTEAMTASVCKRAKVEDGRVSDVVVVDDDGGGFFFLLSSSWRRGGGGEVAGAAALENDLVCRPLGSMMMAQLYLSSLVCI